MNRSFFMMVIVVAAAFQACEDVIDVDLPETDKRLVVDGLVRIADKKEIDRVSIKLTTTTAFFNADVPIIADAKVELLTSSKTYTMAFDSEFYSVNVAREVLNNEDVTLHINYNGEDYTGTSKLISTVPIDTLIQGTNTLFSGDETEIIIAYTDPSPSTDYYLFDLDYGFYFASEDTFYQGSPFSFSYFYDGLNMGDEINIGILGVDKTFYDYMNIIIAQTGQDSGGPFDAPPAVLKGNIRNITDPSHYALGYFAIARTYSKKIVIK